ncbi:hypothetical protein [Actinomadura physcomitrii]|uniref:hypothetical protein n=1 Tax=Actinomadura physcomitrii TaxID=2650748 RepID=UPI001F3B4EFD|nr:hypothetical protein [Actinomadura physcomitrii]
MIGFDYARTFNPPARQGTATGIVNVGGFVAALVTILLIGFVLDALSPGGDFTLSAFRAAWTVQAAIWTIGVAGVLRTRSLTRRHLALAERQKSHSLADRNVSSSRSEMN